MKKVIFILLLVFVLPTIEPQYSFAGERAKKSYSAKKAEKKRKKERKKECHKAYQTDRSHNPWYQSKTSSR